MSHGAWLVCGIGGHEIVLNPDTRRTAVETAAPMAPRTRTARRVVANTRWPHQQDRLKPPLGFRFLAGTPTCRNHVQSRGLCDDRRPQLLRPVPHPSGEHTPAGDEKAWHVGPHRRRFLTHVRPLDALASPMNGLGGRGDKIVFVGHRLVTHEQLWPVTSRDALLRLVDSGNA